MTSYGMLVGLILLIFAGELALARLARHVTRKTGWAYIWVHQAMRLTSAVMLVLGLQMAGAPVLRFLQMGIWNAPAVRNMWLGIAAGESWGQIGLTFLILITLVTAGAMLVAMWPRLNVTRISVGVLCQILLFSLCNAVSEELMYRVAILSLPQLELAFLCGASAIAFGLPHYFGYPRRLLGILLAGFLGYFLARSVVETGG